MTNNKSTEALFPAYEPEHERRRLERDFSLMKEYLLMCFYKEDWHGVMDASADIREIASKLSMLNLVEAPRNDCPIQENCDDT